MKKFFLSLCAFVIFTAAATAQTAEAKTDKAAEKEAKAKMKQKQNEDIEKAMIEAGFNADEVSKFKDLLKDYGGKSSEVKKSTTLSEAEKEAQLKAIQTEKNNKLTELVGEDKYRAYNAARRKQKEADAAAAAGTTK